MTTSNTIEFKTLGIPIGDLNVASYNLPDYVLSQDKKTLILFVQPDKYKRNIGGNGYSLIATGCGRQLKIGLKEIAIAVEIFRPEPNIIYAIEKIAESALINETPIVLQDAVRPERDDLASGITLRSGYIFAIKDIEGSVRSIYSKANFFPAGCGFTFTQISLNYF